MILKKSSSRLVFLISLLPILLIVILGSLLAGSADISLIQMFKIIIGEVDGVQSAIFYKIRLPRVVLGIGVGGALALSGTLVQAIFRNPLVEPYTLGISGGASLGVALSLLLGLSLGKLGLPVFAIIGASIVSLFIITSSVGSSGGDRILLIGVMISFISSSTLSLIFSISDAQTLQTIIFWIMGSLEQSGGSLYLLLFTVSLLAIPTSLLLANSLNGFALGEEEATHLGIGVGNIRLAVIIITTVLTGFAVSLAGVIGFVGLVVPHTLRLIMGRDHRFLIPGSWLGGAIFLVFADTIARTVAAPTVIPVGAVTGVIGGVLFIFLLKKSRGSFV
jgi:iron complex transport system permease protein